MYHMNTHHTSPKFLVFFILLIITLMFSGIFSQTTFAKAESVPEYSNEITGNTSPNEPTTQDPGYTQKNNTIRIREPFPGQSNVIDVSTSKGSINILAEYVSGIFRFVAALSVIIGVIVLMAAGFKIMVAGGDTSARDDAKEWIGKVFMGLAFLFLSGLFLKTINPHFYVFGGGNNSGSGQTNEEWTTEEDSINLEE